MLGNCGKIIKLGSAVHVLIDGTAPILMPTRMLKKVLAGEEVPLRRIEPHPEGDCEIVRGCGECRLYGAGGVVLFSVDRGGYFAPAAGIKKLLEGAVLDVPLSDHAHRPLHDTGLRAGLPRNFGG
ncbi:MAG: hypothetical protein JXA08_05050 [Methanomicrobiaceae archaeon]|nr:hypothetical protein [Methanomicrobiaceae archaeon]